MTTRRTRAKTPAPNGMTATPSEISDAASALVGGRLSIDASWQQWNKLNILLPPESAESQWQLWHLDGDALDKIPPTRLLELLTDLSPDISRALWDFLRLCNPGWEVQALKPNTDTVDTRGQAALDVFFVKLSTYYGSPDVPINRLFTALFARGALLAELVLSDDLHTPVDLATPDPASVRFRRYVDDVRGPLWVPGQWQQGTFTLLDRPTIQYIAVDPLPAVPYGRPIAAPALFSCLFLLGLLHDLRRVIRQQGYPRLDIEVQAAVVQEYLKGLNVASLGGFKEAVQALMDVVKKEYAHLKPDDAFFHTDAVKINRPVGAIDASSLRGVEPIIEMLERMTTRALKSMPVLMGTTQGTTETQANREWEIMAAGIKSIQHLVEAALENLLTLGLQVQGIQARVEFRFAELRAAELLRDEQTLALKLANAQNAYGAGFVSQDEASLMAVGHPADVPEPRETATTATPSGGAPGETEAAPSTGAQEDGQDKARSRAVRAAEKVRPKGKPLASVPETVSYSAAERKALSDGWDEAMANSTWEGMLDAEVID